MSRVAIPQKIRDFILIASKHQCSICQVDTIEVHHIKPVSEGGTNDLENLMVLCPNHHTEYHQGKFTIGQMRTYRTQWLQKCKVFLEVGLPTEQLTKDREVASNLPLDKKIQFIEESANCVVETLSIDDDRLSLFCNTPATTISEITKNVIILSQLLYRLFKECTTIKCVFPNNNQEQLSTGLDLPEHLTFLVQMSDIDRFVFGRDSMEEFWKKIQFSKKKEVNVINDEREILSIPWLI
ncbi:MAG: HNH endonuclease [Thaumarchaeota archaeon]|nr:HNH endonuclease [Nitrososphaerota archaeon]